MKKGQKMKLTKVAAALSAVLLFGCDDITPNSTDSGSGSGTDSGIDSGTDSGSGSGTGSGTDSGSGTNLAAQILDTLTDDGGELRVKLADAAQVSEIVSGQVSATLQLQVDSDTTITSEETKNTGYVSIYSAGTSSTNLHGDIIFASNGVIKQRDENGDQIEVEGATYTEGDVIDFVAKWDETTYSFSLDGGEIFFGPYASRDTTPVTVISFKLGDTSGQSNHEFNVDDVVIEDAGASVFSDNFDSYTEGDSLDPELNADAIYNKSSSEATVQIVSFGTGSTDGGEDGSEGGDDGIEGGSGDGSEGDGTETTSTQVAAIADTLDDDTGELRYSLDTEIATGQVNTSFLIDENETQSAYLTVFSNGGTSTSRAEQIADIKLSKGNISIRDVENDATLANYTQGEWVDIQLNWEISGDADATYDSVYSGTPGTADITLTVNGTKIGDYAIEYYTADEDLGAKDVQIRYAGGSATTEYILYADDLKIYSDAGETEVFSDDFETYVINEALDSDGDVYHNNSSEATVVAQPE